MSRKLCRGFGRVFNMFKLTMGELGAMVVFRNETLTIRGLLSIWGPNQTNIGDNKNIELKRFGSIIICLVRHKSTPLDTFSNCGQKP